MSYYGGDSGVFIGLQKKKDREINELSQMYREEIKKLENGIKKLVKENKNLKEQLKND